MKEIHRDRVIEGLFSDNWRTRVSSEIRLAREKDSSALFERYRDLSRYVCAIMGLEHFLEYCRSIVKGSKTILDIGIGGGIATSQLRKSDWSNGLTIEGTNLSFQKDTVKVFGGERLHITAAETLRNIPDSSMAGIISVYGVAYSVAPEEVVNQINRVLCPSGVFKTVFYLNKRSENIHGIQPDSSDAFEIALQKIGFDVAIVKHEGEDAIILVAVKAPVVVSAKSILREDQNDWTIQLTEALDAKKPI